MTRDEVIRQIAQMISGLQVPVSFHKDKQSLVIAFGTAYAAWQSLFDELVGFGWTSTDELERKLKEVL